ncbi:lysin A [Mycobacterium phage Reptar3000]|nr:lysin A [Mycobacterium phage Reptar3000]
MSVLRANVEAAKSFIRNRLGNPYVYGGALSASDPRQGTDCSEVWQTVLEMVHGRYVQGRQAEGATTESYRYIEVGQVGPFGTIRVARPQDIPANAVVKLAFHHQGNGGAESHMWGELDGMRIESASGKGLVTQPAAWPIDHSYANAWAYLPGPIVEDGTPIVTPEPRDTLYADVSEWQRPVDDSYPYRVLCIRSNDGTYRDKNWSINYQWCKRAVDDGRLAFFIVYFVWRPNWRDAVATLKSQVGEPHPKMAVMIDCESWGGQISGNQSAGLNAAFDEIAAWLGDRRRVIGYGNRGDLDRLWPQKPDGMRIVLAAYGSNPDYPGKIAHQYTDGQGYGGGLPEGASPFGNCDMNSADGYTATQFAAALGIEATTGEDGLLSALTPDEQREALFLLRILADKRFVSRSPFRHLGEKETETVAGFGLNTDGLTHAQYTIEAARLGDPTHIALLREVASAEGDDRYPDRQWDAQFARRVLDSLDIPVDPNAEPAAPAAVETPSQSDQCALGSTCKLNGSSSACAIGGGRCALVASPEAGA